MVDLLPCDRGIPNNALSRGWHNFAAASGTNLPVCTFCGMTREKIATARDARILASWHPDLGRYEKAAVDSLVEWKKRNPGGEPIGIHANAYSLRVLASRSGSQDLDPNEGGWLMGYHFEVDNTIENGRFQIAPTNI